MNNDKGSDLLGGCEIENKRVMELFAKVIGLPGRKYEVKHLDTQDKRGIDVGLEPVRFGRPHGGKLNENGYRDHFLISMVITKE